MEEYCLSYNSWEKTILGEKCSEIENKFGGEEYDTAEKLRK